MLKIQVLLSFLYLYDLVFIWLDAYEYWLVVIAFATLTQLLDLTLCILRRTRDAKTEARGCKKAEKNRST